MLNGWQTRTAAELDATIKTWGEIFNHYKIPPAMYERLYRRAVDTRQMFLQNGKEPPPMNAELLISCWTGANGLKTELAEELVKQGKTLTANAASVCRYCSGSGWKPKQEGNYAGVERCSHE